MLFLSSRWEGCSTAKGGLRWWFLAELTQEMRCVLASPTGSGVAPEESWSSVQEYMEYLVYILLKNAKTKSRSQSLAPSVRKLSHPHILVESVSVWSTEKGALWKVPLCGLFYSNEIPNSFQTSSGSLERLRTGQIVFFLITCNTRKYVLRCKGLQSEVYWLWKKREGEVWYNLVFSQNPGYP